MAISYESLVVAPKSQEASNYKINEQNRQQNEQPIIHSNFEHQNEQKLNRTEHTEQKNNDGSFRHDAKEKGSNEYERLELEKKKKEEEQKRNEEHKKMFGCTFDITI